MGRLLEAREVLRRVSEFPQRPDEPRPFSSARQRADRLLGDIAPRIPRVTLEIAGLPDGVVPELTWDGKHLDPSSIGGYLEADPGAHRVVGDAPGQPRVSRDVRLAEGQALQITLTFGAATPATPSPQAPLATTSAPATPRDGHQPTLLWIGLGVAVVGVAAGSVSGVRSLSLTKSAEQHCDGSRCSPAAQPDIDSAKTWANVSNVAFGVAAAGLTVATWQWFAHRNERRTPRVAVGVGHVALVGAF
jgi:hypothetical protein